jgi:AmmeMemoRadiSam system protein B
MLFAKAGGATTVRTLGYANSGDAPGIGDKRRVVGYGAALFLKP